MLRPGFTRRWFRSRVGSIVSPRVALPPPDPWNPDLYDRFKNERQQPFGDLLALVQPTAGMRVIDLGCGTGELTRQLHRSLAAARTTGVDRSAAMLARALPSDACRFVCADVLDYRPDHPVDLVFSNAALHWLPDHPSLLTRLSQFLAPEGQLAVQVPANDDHPSHTAAAAVAAEAPFAEALAGYARRSPVLTPEAYATLLARLGYRDQHVRLQVYAHWLESRDAVVQWVRSTLLTDYLTRLPAALADHFLARYRTVLQAALPDDRPYFYGFKRILLWGRL
jgi:trans-aconitate 2-methyltransferase